jgi:hypothetical protein
MFVCGAFATAVEVRQLLNPWCTSLVDARKGRYMYVHVQYIICLSIPISQAAHKPLVPF